MTGSARCDSKEPLGPTGTRARRQVPGRAQAARPGAAAGGFRGLRGGNACQMDAGGRCGRPGWPGLRGLVAPLAACPWGFLLHLAGRERLVPGV